MCLIHGVLILVSTCSIRSRTGLLEYDLHIAPHIDPRNIRFRLDRAKGVRITAEGELAFRAGAVDG